MERWLIVHGHHHEIKLFLTYILDVIFQAEIIGK